jgi:hypothetical protein
MDDADGPCEAPFGEGQLHQPSTLHGVHHRRLRNDRDAAADLDRALDRFDVVELHHTVYLDPVPRQHAVDRLACRDVAFERDELRSLQPRQADAASAGQRMIR